MKSAFHKIAAGFFFVTDAIVASGLTFGCCFEKPEDVHPFEYAVALIFGAVFLSIVAFAALSVFALTIAGIWTYPIWAAGITGTLTVALLVGYGRRVSRKGSKTK